MLQCVLPFKLETTNDKITPYAGLAIFGEFIHATGLLQQINNEMPAPGSNRGYQPSLFVEPLLLMLHGGGRSLEDLRKISTDSGLRELLKIKNVPSSDATGNWLRRMGSTGLSGLQKMNNIIIRRAINRDDNSQFTLDIDATQIVAEKYAANFTYKGEKGYMPIVGHLAENGLVVGDDFREGNVAPATRNLEFIQYCCKQMPKRNQITALRADSATYQASIFNWCEKNSIQFAIGGRLDSATKKVIDLISDTAWEQYGEKQIAETVHSMEKTQKAFRLIVIKHPQQEPLPLKDDTDEQGITPSARYSVIATNRKETTADVIAWYNKRGDTSENRIKDLKIGFGMERMPCGTLAANSIFFRIGVLAYNLFVLFKMTTLPQSMQRLQIQTIRWQVYQIAGKIVKHAGTLYLKVNQSSHQLLNEIRARSYEMMTMK